MTKREQILKAAEFDRGKLDKFWLNCAEPNDVESAKYENSRLMPLITALAERVEVLEGTLKSAQEGLDLFGSCTLPPDDISGRTMYANARAIRLANRQALTTQTTLDALLRGG